MNTLAILFMVLGAGCGLTGLVVWVLWLRWEWERIERNYALQDEWYLGKVALSDLSDEVLLDVIHCEGWKDQLPPTDDYVHACYQEWERRAESEERSGPDSVDLKPQRNLKGRRLKDEG